MYSRLHTVKMLAVTMSLHPDDHPDMLSPQCTGLINLSTLPDPKSSADQFN